MVFIKKQAGLIIATLCLIVLVSPGTARATTSVWEWCPAQAPHNDPTCVDGGSVQGAVNLAAQAGVPGMIFIYSGVFSEHVQHDQE
jgi:hypothetical protein